MKSLLFSFLFFLSMSLDWAFAACYLDLTPAITSCQGQAPRPGGDWYLEVRSCTEVHDYGNIYIRCLHPTLTSQSNCGAYGPGTGIGFYKVCPNAEPAKPEVKVIPSNTANQCGSVIRADNLVLNEYINLTGVPYKLTYSSDKVKGRKDWYERTIQVTLAMCCKTQLI